MADDFFKWDPIKLTTQVKAMDDEHVVLIELMNKLHKAHIDKKSFADQLVLLSQLLKYSESHFRNEERFFDSLPYVQADIHKKIHTDLIARLKEFGEKFKSEQALGQDFFMFLKVWLSAHIMGIDAKYGKIAVDQKRSA